MMARNRKFPLWQGLIAMVPCTITSAAPPDWKTEVLASLPLPTGVSGDHLLKLPWTPKTISGAPNAPPGSPSARRRNAFVRPCRPASQASDQKKAEHIANQKPAGEDANGEV
jgi:hypothetical protein